MKIQFILGKEPYPVWFSQLEETITYNTKENGDLISIEIQKTTGSVTAYPGDTILKQDDKIIVIPAKVAEEYGRKL